MEGLLGTKRMLKRFWTHQTMWIDYNILLGDNVTIQRELEEFDVKWVPFLTEDLIKRGWWSKKSAQSYRSQQGP